jgi:hypothetical protein
MASLSDNYKHLWTQPPVQPIPAPQPAAPVAPPITEVAQTPKTPVSTSAKSWALIGCAVLVMYAVYKIYTRRSSTDVVKQKNIDILEKLRQESLKRAAEEAAQSKSASDDDFEPVEAAEGPTVEEISETAEAEPEAETQ